MSLLSRMARLLTEGLQVHSSVALDGTSCTGAGPRSDAVGRTSARRATSRRRGESSHVPLQRLRIRGTGGRRHQLTCQGYVSAGT